MAKFDFSGYATKNDIKCTDGRTIRRDAFKEDDGRTVPLVYQHLHSDPKNVLGHCLLENRDDGVYAYCCFNSTENAQNAKEAVRHGDITSLSIYANQLQQRGGDVYHGIIREVSLVLAGANKGARIDNVCIAHSDGTSEDCEDEVIIDFGLELEHAEEENSKSDENFSETEVVETPAEPEVIEHKDKEEPPVETKTEEKETMADSEVKKSSNNETVADVWETFTDKQKEVVYFLIAQALMGDDKKVEHSDEGGEDFMKYNAFESNGDVEYGATLSHAEFADIMTDAQRMGSFKEAFLMHAQDYGIENIGLLFPDARLLENTPGFIQRDNEWVNDILDSTTHVPFSRLKSIHANITADEARAKGYIKGNQKKEEVFPLLKRTTSPTTIYKKQKLDRDDVVDIRDMNVVAWMNAEMNVMLKEELARAILIGDGREADDEDHIDDQCIRPIYKDNGLYTIRKTVNFSYSETNASKAEKIIEALIKAKKSYKGTGRPTFYTTSDVTTTFLLAKDSIGRRLYTSLADVAAQCGLAAIKEVPVMEGQNYYGKDLVGIMVNLKDYRVGTDKGGELTSFDDFDIDFNQYKYLLETRCSGSLMDPFTAVVIESTDSSLTLSCSPESPTNTVLGKSVASLQKSVSVGSEAIYGTLKYVTGYTGYSGNPELQSGNFLALKFDAEEGATTTIELKGGSSGPVTLDSDMNAVVRIEDNTTQYIEVVSSLNGVSTTRTYDLTRLYCERG